MTRQSRLPPFLLTRPAAQGDRFAAMLKNRFGNEARIIDSPLLAPRFLAPVLPDVQPKVLVFTSETAVAAFQRLSANPALAAVTRAWCVGDRTAQAARDVGLDARSASGDAAALSAAIIAAGEGGPLLHLRGQDVRGDLTEHLISAGIETYSAIVYAQEPQDLTAEAIACLQTDGPVLVPLFSPRTASLFVAAMVAQPPKAALWSVSLSPAVADAAAALPAKVRAIADHPDASAMISAMAGLIAAVRPA